MANLSIKIPEIWSGPSVYKYDLLNGRKKDHYNVTPADSSRSKMWSYD